MGKENGRPRVAIACQGGGSHTAFAAGALKRLLREDGYDFVALSGTSGGAICAFLAWHALANGGGFSRAAELLDGFWEDNSAGAPYERFWNDWLVWVNRLQGSAYLPSVSPHGTPFAYWAQNELRRAIESRIGPGETGTPREDGPMLLVGAVDVLSGAFRAFNSRRDRISVKTILASTALPTLFRAVRTDGGIYWDGLFSQNPPVRELPDAEPDEIWVIQIDPEKRDTEPTSIADILDRRNELAGNISLYQEVHSIKKINQLVEALGKGDEPRGKRLRVPGVGEYRHIEVRWIELTRPLDFASKLDRSPSFIRSLLALGEESAEEFLDRVHLKT